EPVAWPASSSPTPATRTRESTGHAVPRPPGAEYASPAAAVKHPFKRQDDPSQTIPQRRLPPWPKETGRGRGARGGGSPLVRGRGASPRKARPFDHRGGQPPRPPQPGRNRAKRVSGRGPGL